MMRSGCIVLVGMTLLGLSACAPEAPAIQEDVLTTETGDMALPPANEGPMERIPELEQCDAADYRPLIGTPIAAVTLPRDEMLRAYGENDIITQDYLPQRTNIVYGLDGIIRRVDCG